MYKMLCEQVCSIYSTRGMPQKLAVKKLFVSLVVKNNRLFLNENSSVFPGRNC